MKARGRWYNTRSPLPCRLYRSIAIEPSKGIGKEGKKASAVNDKGGRYIYNSAKCLGVVFGGKGCDIEAAGV